MEEDEKKDESDNSCSDLDSIPTSSSSSQSSIDDRIEILEDESNDSFKSLKRKADSESADFDQSGQEGEDVDWSEIPSDKQLKIDKLKIARVEQSKTKSGGVSQILPQTQNISVVNSLNNQNKGTYLIVQQPGQSPNRLPTSGMSLLRLPGNQVPVQNQFLLVPGPTNVPNQRRQLLLIPTTAAGGQPKLAPRLEKASTDSEKKSPCKVAPESLYLPKSSRKKDMEHFTSLFHNYMEKIGEKPENDGSLSASKPCRKCTFRFTNESALNQHEKHSFELGLICHRCDKMLIVHNVCSILSHLKGHHTDWKSGILQMSVKWHLDSGISSQDNKLDISYFSNTDKPSIRGKCLYCSATVDDLKSHLRGEPEEQARSQCPHCQQLFGSKCALIAHMNTCQYVGKREKKEIDDNVSSYSSCPECGLIVRDLEILTKHYYLTCHHNSRRMKFICHFPDCGSLFDDFSHYIDHLSFNHDSLLRKCPLCPVAIKVHGETPVGSRFAEHMTNHHKDHKDMNIESTTKAYSCIFCPKKLFVQRHSYTMHMATHAKQNLVVFYSCYICPKGFLSYEDFRHHLKQTHDFQLCLFMCPVCGSNYVEQNEKCLKEHVATCPKNKDEKAFTYPKVKEFTHEQCDFCLIAFRTNDAYKIHMKEKHDGISQDIQPYQPILKVKPMEKKTNKPATASMEKIGKKICFECGEKYLSWRELGEHESTCHNKNYPAICHLCNSSFSNRNYLDEHLSFEHLGRVRQQITQLICNICGKSKTFAKKDKLRQHLLTFHDKNLTKEELADFIENGKEDLSTSLSANDVRLLSFSKGKRICARCSFETKNSEDFIIHIRKHAVQTIDHVVQCTYCGLNFVGVAGLKRHVFIVHDIGDSIDLKSTSKEEIPQMISSLIDSNESEKCMSVKKEETLSCRECQEEFDDKDVLAKHLRKHGMAFIKHTLS
ncbi:DgyrCDS762 [Dimorphilus gyrociliatus]|uniref:DgyrCDS762 n=1 Tax=Dimorphilus gyrociliatus TaxID=2664684 RepID=A0A7I8V8D2_9ANNE|nr:DgyrCDS762 [Dimorphilus gyrociliatus]